MDAQPRLPATKWSFDELWAGQAASVRRDLARFGVSEADLDDLVQEVFLVAHAKSDLLPSVQQIDAWLREVCRRVAAQHRRRAHRRHEVVVGEPPEQAHQGTVVDAHLEQGQEEERLHQALDRLDDASRDLVALHELGNLPLVDVAELVEADRKTVSKRLGVALRRLTYFLSSESSQNTPAPASTRPSVPPSEPPSSQGAPFQVLACHPDVNIGLVGAVVVAIWPGPPSIGALDVLGEQLHRAASICDSSVVYLAVIEPSTRPPTLEARQKIIAMIKEHAVHMQIHVTAIEGGAAWIAQPIMTALSHLARAPFPLYFFKGVPGAVRWLSQRHPHEANANASQMLSAIERLKAVASAARLQKS